MSAALKLRKQEKKKQLTFALCCILWRCMLLSQAANWAGEPSSGPLGTRGPCPWAWMGQRKKPPPSRGWEGPLSGASLLICQSIGPLRCKVGMLIIILALFPSLRKFLTNSEFQISVGCRYFFLAPRSGLGTQPVLNKYSLNGCFFSFLTSFLLPTACKASKLASACLDKC